MFPLRRKGLSFVMLWVESKALYKLGENTSPEPTALAQDWTFKILTWGGGTLRFQQRCKEELLTEPVLWNLGSGVV